MSQSAKGRKFSEEWREAQSKRLKGRKHTYAELENMKAACKGRLRNSKGQFTKEGD
jgi:hypothetical protein